MGAKQTSQLIPLCHNIPLDKVDVALSIDASRQAVNIQATAKTQAYTGTVYTRSIFTVWWLCHGHTAALLLILLEQARVCDAGPECMLQHL